MNIKEAIKKRRSIRRYQNREISDDLIEELIDAARLSPSGNNAQPSKYFIIKDTKTKNRLKENKIFEQNFVYEAPIIIVCCTDPTVYKNKIRWGVNSNKIRAIRDLSIASSFLILRATEIGLGTCYVGWMKKEKIKKVLNLPKEYLVPYVITIGYPAEKPKPTSRKNKEEILL